MDRAKGKNKSTRILYDGTLEWHSSSGKLHRDEKDPKTGLALPAVIWPNGTLLWYQNGNLGRIDRDSSGTLLPFIKYIPKRININDFYETYFKENSNFPKKVFKLINGDDEIFKLEVREYTKEEIEEIIQFVNMGRV